MKRANKTGTVSKLSGNRRRPYVAREGITGEQRIIGYGTTSMEARDILKKFNEVFFSKMLQKEYFSEEVTEFEVVEELIDAGSQQEDYFLSITGFLPHICPCCQKKMESNEFPLSFREVYELWFESKWETFGKASQVKFHSAYKHFAPLYKEEFTTITLSQYDSCIRNCGHGYSTQNGMKTLLAHLEQFVVEEWGDRIVFQKKVDRLQVHKNDVKEKPVFTEDEIDRLLLNSELDWVDSVLFLIYTGLTVRKMLDIKIDDVDLEQSKVYWADNPEGISLHPNLCEVLQQKMDYERNESVFLFSTPSGKQICTSNFHVYWNKVMDKMEMSHSPKDCRYTHEKLLEQYGNDVMSGRKLLKR